MKNLIFPFVVSLFHGGLCYLLTDSILYSVIIFIVYVLVLSSLEPLVLIPFRRKERITFEGYSFVHSFLLSLIASSSLEEAYKSSKLSMRGELKKITDSLEPREIHDRLLALSLYFNSDIYNLFLSILRLYEEEGGDITLLAEPFLLEASEEEKELIRRNRIKKKTAFEFISLFFITSLIFVFLRYGLSAFYGVLKGNLPYILCSLLYFLLALISYVLLVLAITESNSSTLKERWFKNGKKQKIPAESV